MSRFAALFKAAVQLVFRDAFPQRETQKHYFPFDPFSLMWQIGTRHGFLTCVFVGSAGRMLSWGRNEAVSLFGLPPSFLDVLVSTKTPHLRRTL